MRNQGFMDLHRCTSNANLRNNKAQMQQLSSGVIDINEQTAFRGSTFKPVMIGSINLDQLTEAITVIAWLIGRLRRLDLGIQSPLAVIQRRSVSTGTSRANMLLSFS